VSWGAECAGRWFTGQIVECRCAVNRLWSWAGFVTRTTSPVSGRSALHYAMASGDCAVVRTVATAMRDGARKRELISSSRLGVVSGPGKSDHPPPTPTPPPFPMSWLLVLASTSFTPHFRSAVEPLGAFSDGAGSGSGEAWAPGEEPGYLYDLGRSSYRPRPPPQSSSGVWKRASAAVCPCPLMSAAQRQCFAVFGTWMHCVPVGRAWFGSRVVWVAGPLRALSPLPSPGSRRSTFSAETVALHGCRAERHGGPCCAAACPGRLLLSAGPPAGADAEGKCDCPGCSRRGLLTGPGPLDPRLGQHP
jgi:hypothetical protein